MKSDAPSSIITLVNNFSTHLEHYKSQRYNETQLRREFLDPLFNALGWDIANTNNYAEAYKDVVHEDAIKIGGHTKAPDYCFRVGGQRKFFLEAKKPSIKIKNDPSAAYQLRRYAWSAKLPLSILSDFEEFAVYDCRVRPRKDDKPSTARILYLTFDQYEEKWHDISSIFSREAILKGSFDKYADSTRKKRGTAQVDDEFLVEIERWREILAKNFALRNPSLSDRDLNYAVQQTIDRIIFLRICEDRGSEDYGRLQSIEKGGNCYKKLLELFKAADDRYNSGLFHFSNEKNRPGEPDTLTPKLVLDDTALRDIVKNIYYPDSPYEFSVLPADILGQVYERFLGKTIRLTGSHKAVIEDKPEIRKAGGVFYTPTYIVSHIIKNTLGTILNPSKSGNPTPVPVKQASKIRVLDPACGSGSFLITAYQYLLDWHLEQYSKKPQYHARGKNPKLYQSPRGEYRLTTGERKRILINSVYGVDIDRQAVEVTKLSLLLKVLEGETEQIQQRDWVAERERILPDLDQNIVCGNSLIAPDFYRTDGCNLNDDEKYRINAFSWQSSFPSIMNGGGFDCVIGNPPYIFTRELLSEHEKQYFSRTYTLGWEKKNTYLLFMEKLLSLLSPKGKGGYIVPNSWLTIESAKNLRAEYVNHIHCVMDLNYPVFQGVSMEPCIFIAQHDNPDPNVGCSRARDYHEFYAPISTARSRRSWTPPDFRFTFSDDESITKALEKIRQTHIAIGDVFDVRTGLQAYEAGKGNPPQSKEDVKNHIFDRDSKEDETCHKYLNGKDIGRYQVNWGGMWMKYGPWLSQPREISMFTRPRILIREITNQPPYCINACYVEGTYLNNKSILNILDDDDDSSRLKVLCAVMNSKIMSQMYRAFAVKAVRNIFPKIVIKNLREFTIPCCLKEADRHQDIITNIENNVDALLDLNHKLSVENNPQTRGHIQAQIRTLNQENDELVLALYDLNSVEAGLLFPDSTPSR